jgi:cation diffusion facilitator CzcD-associated flavoprotein CzcO
VSRGDVAIIGAGPYGLAAAAYLRAAGMAPRVFGEVMGAWLSMPRGMRLRSFREATSIGDPSQSLSIERFEQARGRPVPVPVPVEDFVEYGRWFQERAVPEVDARLVVSLESARPGFRLLLDDGEEIDAHRVVVGAGIGYFAWVAPEFRGFDTALVSHSSAHRDFEGFRDRRVLVVGAGQSALESAALACEGGAEVEVVARAANLTYLRGGGLHDRSGSLRRLLYPKRGVGPPGINWLMGSPSVFRRLPARWSGPLAHRAIRPAAAPWLRPRLEPVRITLGRRVVALEPDDAHLTVALDDGTERVVDHLVAATGYHVDVGLYPFLARELVDRLARVNGFPRLSTAYESSVSGLYFVGAPAAGSLGPGMRFVSHSGMAANAIARATASRVRSR